MSADDGVRYKGQRLTLHHSILHIELQLPAVDLHLLVPRQTVHIILAPEIDLQDVRELNLGCAVALPVLIELLWLVLDPEELPLLVLQL